MDFEQWQMPRLFRLDIAHVKWIVKCICWISILHLHVAQHWLIPYRCIQRWQEKVPIESMSEFLFQFNLQSLSNNCVISPLNTHLWPIATTTRVGVSRERTIKKNKFPKRILNFVRHIRVIRNRYVSWWGWYDMIDNNADDDNNNNNINDDRSKHG